MTEVDRLYRRGLLLEYLTVGYNVVEAVVAIVFGGVAGSIALIGFGLDSIVESLSGMVLIWRLRQHGNLSEAEEEKRERKAVRFVAVTFFVLAAYISVEAVRKLAGEVTPEPSLAGVIIASVSLLAMPALAWQKHRTGKRIGSRALVADSKETLVCGLLSLALLLGLGANYLFGLWQADPITAMVIAVFLFREGAETWREAGEGKESVGV